jgi:hypothetical protein
MGGKDDPERRKQDEETAKADADLRRRREILEAILKVLKAT